MAKYDEALVERIAELIEEDEYTLSDVCKAVGISRAVFYKWQAEKPDFVRAVEEATERRDERLLTIARQSLRRKLEGYTKRETVIKYVPDPETGELVVKECTVREKYVAPDTAALMHVIEGEKVDGRRRGVGTKRGKPLQVVVSSEKDKENLEKLRERLRSDVSSYPAKSPLTPEGGTSQGDNISPLPPPIERELHRVA